MFGCSSKLALKNHTQRKPPTYELETLECSARVSLLERIQPKYLYEARDIELASAPKELSSLLEKL